MYTHRRDKTAQDARSARTHKQDNARNEAPRDDASRERAPEAGDAQPELPQALAAQANLTQGRIMQLPLFPLKNVVLFPGMVLPLHIFELRYREMIGKCIDEKLPFGVVLIRAGEEVGDAATPCTVGTAARITRVDRLDNGHMNITTVGTKRFRVLELDTRSNSYLSATVRPLPFINGSTKAAEDLAHKVRPRIIEYVELLSEASKHKLKLDRLPEDPMTLAFLVGIAMQVTPEDKQKLLERVGVPQMLSWSLHLLSREILFTRHMVETQPEILSMNSGPTGYIFPN